MRAVVLTTLLSFVLSLCVACAGAPERGSSGAALKATDYYPLAVGNTWRYRTTPAPPGQEAGNDEIKILDRDGQGFFVDSRGYRLAPRTDGLFDGQRFLLQEPVEEGREWIAAPDPSTVEHYRVKAVGAVVTVPAGAFSGCVDVESTLPMKNPATGTDAVLTSSWTFAPGVGLVLWRQTLKSGESEQVLAQMELVSFDLVAAGGPAGS